MTHKIAIIGSGPAGLAAAIYTSRAEIDTTIYAGEEPGGQLTKTTEVENYPGVIGKTGPELMMTMMEQAQKFGAKIIYENVSKLEVTSEKGQIEVCGDSNNKYDGVILAMGASPRMMGIGEEKYYGKGFSTCAVCDAAFYRGKNVYVVGGGDAAIEDAMALTKFASSVTILVRGDKFKASIAMQKRVDENKDKINVMWKTSLVGIKGEKIETLIVSQSHSDTVTQLELPADGLFFAIGHIPATGWLRNTDLLDENGYVKVGSGGWPTMTSIEGVFGAGDCVDHRYRQASTASGMGVSAALDCERWLESK